MKTEKDFIMAEFEKCTDEELDEFMLLMVSSPYAVYENKGWVDVSNFLSSPYIHGSKIPYLSYEESIKFVHKLNLKSRADWEKYCQSNELPNNIPRSPRQTYKRLGGWISWGDWLGTGYTNTSDRKYLSYGEAKKIIHPLKLKSEKEWKKYKRNKEIPKNIPLSPQGVYQRKQEWVSWGDFLGSNNIDTSKRSYWNFEKAKKFVSNLHLVYKKDWVNYVKSGKKPDNIPSKPDHVYKDKGWKDWGDWLGSPESMAKCGHKAFNFTKKQVEEWIQSDKPDKQLRKENNCSQSTISNYKKKYHAGELD